MSKSTWKNCQTHVYKRSTIVPYVRTLVRHHWLVLRCAWLKWSSTSFKILLLFEDAMFNLEIWQTKLFWFHFYRLEDFWWMWTSPGEKVFNPVFYPTRSFPNRIFPNNILTHCWTNTAWEKTRIRISVRALLLLLYFYRITLLCFLWNAELLLNNGGPTDLNDAHGCWIRCEPLAPEGPSPSDFKIHPHALL